MVSLIQVKNQELFRNGQWTASFAVKVGKALKLPERDLNTLQLAGYLKNLGLLLLPDLYTEKNISMFSADELRMYYRFPLLGEQVLKKLSGFKSVAAAISDQLERFEGTGPKGTVGDNIPLTAQVLGIAHDAYQVLYMRSKETGSETLYGRNFMINHIRKNLNKLYGPKVAHAAILVLSEDLKSN